MLMGEGNFLQLFPGQSGASVVVVDTDAASAAGVSKLLAGELSDFSVTVDRTSDVLAAYENVQNTYLATFQLLGALGLLLGAMGLAVVLLRNVVERKAELAMLAALGFKRIDRLRMLLIENGGTIITRFSRRDGVRCRGDVADARANGAARTRGRIACVAGIYFCDGNGGAGDCGLDQWPRGWAGGFAE